jgi:hypothetical protein
MSKSRLDQIVRLTVARPLQRFRISAPIVRSAGLDLLWRRASVRSLVTLAVLLSSGRSEVSKQDVVSAGHRHDAVRIRRHCPVGIRPFVKFHAEA